MVLHVHAAIWKERGLLSAKNSLIQHKSGILQLLEAVNKPQKIAIIHCQGYQRGDSDIIEGNNLR